MKLFHHATKDKKSHLATAPNLYDCFRDFSQEKFIMAYGVGINVKISKLGALINDQIIYKSLKDTL